MLRPYRQYLMCLFKRGCATTNKKGGDDSPPESERALGTPDKHIQHNRTRELLACSL